LPGNIRAGLVGISGEASNDRSLPGSRISARIARTHNRKGARQRLLAVNDAPVDPACSEALASASDCKRLQSRGPIMHHEIPRTALVLRARLASCAGLPAALCLLLLAPLAAVAGAAAPGGHDRVA